MKHTALYLRVSTEAQADEGYSLAAQAEKLEAYCRMKASTASHSMWTAAFPARTCRVRP